MIANAFKRPFVARRHCHHCNFSSQRLSERPTISNYNIENNESETRICYESNYSIWQFCQLDKHVYSLYVRLSRAPCAHRDTMHSDEMACERHEHLGFTMENPMSHLNRTRLMHSTAMDIRNATAECLECRITPQHEQMFSLWSFSSYLRSDTCKAEERKLF